tara:strand:- start:2860 stop:3588 length:729 start_codon:yes stop_codon:yes gene_type:complete
MKKNILILGYGDIASRLSAILSKDIYKIYGISRSKKNELDNFIEWDWTSTELPNLECKNYESIIFIPKPSNSHQEGYHEGFLKSSDNTFVLLEASKKIIYKKFITISSTGAYGLKTRQDSYLDESSNIVPMYTEKDTHAEDDVELGQHIIRQYELKQINRYKSKLILLRFSGLYTSKPKSKNHLHRDNAAKIIKFFIENDFKFSSHEIFNCTEDAKLFVGEKKSSYGNISNEKLKKLGFIFD